MATVEKKISELTEATSIGSNDFLVVVQGGVTKKIGSLKVSGALRAVIVKDYGAIGDGVSDDSAALIGAIADIGSEYGYVRFTEGTYVIKNVGTPTNITLSVDPGAKINIPAGFNVTINGPIHAGIYPIFSGGGTVSTEVYQSVKPEWWNQYETGSGEALSHAVSFFAPNTQTTENIGGEIKLNRGRYNSPWYAANTLYSMNKDNVSIIGAGKPVPLADKTGLDTRSGSVIAGSVKISANNFRLENCGIDVGSGVLNTYPLQDHAPGVSGVDGFYTFVTNIGTQKNYIYLRNILILGHSMTQPVHGCLIESHDNAYLENCSLMQFMHGFALKSRHLKAYGIDAVDCGYTDVTGCHGDGIIIKSQNADGVISLCEDVQIYGVSVSSTVDQSIAGAGIIIQAHLSLIRNVHIEGITLYNLKQGIIISNYGDTTNSPIYTVKLSKVSIMATDQALTIDGTSGFQVQRCSIRDLSIDNCATPAMSIAQTRELIIDGVNISGVTGTDPVGIDVLLHNYELIVKNAYFSVGTGVHNASEFDIYLLDCLTDGNTLCVNEASSHYNKNTYTRV